MVAFDQVGKRLLLTPPWNAPTVNAVCHVNVRNSKGVTMANLKIRVFKAGETKPETTVTIPTGILKVASRLIPKQAADALKEEGVDLQEIIRLSNSPEACGTIVEVEEHKKKQRIVIALE